MEGDLKRQRSRIVFLWTIVIHNSYYIYCFQLCSQLRLHHHAQTWNMIKVLYSCTFSKLSGSSPGSAKVVSSNCNAPTTAVETVSSSGNYFAVTFFLFFSSEYHFNHRQSRVKHWKRQLKISDDSWYLWLQAETITNCFLHDVFKVTSVIFVSFTPSS